MSENTKIEWADHTFNPWEGCQKVGPGCDHCYAEVRNARFGGGVAVNWGPGAPRRRTSLHNWQLPRKWNKRAERLGIRYRVFCASLADVFDNAVPAEWRADLFELIWRTPHLDWLLLTKRIGNAPQMIRDAAKFGRVYGICAAWSHGSPPPNVWLGATIVNQEEADRDIPKLFAVPAHRLFVSMEPLLGPVDLHRYVILQCDRGSVPGPQGVGGVTCPHCQGNEIMGCALLDWVIVGGESGPGARPMHPDWARGLRDQCKAAGVPFLFKQWGDWAPTSSGDFCRSPTAPEHAEFRDLHGRAGFENPTREGRSILRDGRTCYIAPAGSAANIMRRPKIQAADKSALEAFAAFTRTGKDDPGYQWMFSVGKKAAGRLLDGIEHNGVPS